MLNVSYFLDSAFAVLRDLATGDRIGYEIKNKQVTSNKTIPTFIIVFVMR